MIIYANHLMRSAYQAMEKTATSILSEGRSLYADKNYCATVIHSIDYNILNATFL